MLAMTPRHGLRLLLGALAIAFNLFIGHEAAAQSPPREGAAVWTYLAGLPAAERLAVLKRETAREGELVIYAATGLDRISVFLDKFKKENPGTKVEFLRMTTNELAQKVMTESRAGRSNMDLFISSSDWLGLVGAALAPYQPTTWNDLDPRFRHGSMAEGWTAVDYASLIEVIAWRTDRIPSSEAPKTLDEVANPKWKGRAATIRSREQFIDAMINHYGEKVAMEKVDALAALDNRIFSGIAALSEGLGAGEVDLAWGISGARASRLKANGLPIDFVYQVPPFTLNETVAVGRLAKNPYTAALIMEFVTDLKIMEESDKIEPGRVFGHTKGNFAKALTPDVFVYRELSPDRYRELNRIVQQKFIRGR